jgi:hypothetical protein
MNGLVFGGSLTVSIVVEADAAAFSRFALDGRGARTGIRVLRRSRVKASGRT